ncbi:hypothetical protein [Persephonella sp.]
MKTVRLSEKQIENIKNAVREIFGGSAKAYLIRSRTDISKKGGDIDLLILVKDRKGLYEKKSSC